MKILVLILSVWMCRADAQGITSSHAEIIENIVAQGVPRRGIERILEFRDRNLGATFLTNVYRCQGRDDFDVRICHHEKDRIYFTKALVLKPHPYAVYIDFKKPSRDKRLFVINLESAQVEAEFVAHGVGSGRQAQAERFSNQPESRMTSLGFYLAGEAFDSKNHGKVLRLYGIEPSNSNAYLRDLIFHGADYAEERVLDSQNRLGASWGCPAVSNEFAQKMIPLLENGAIFFHDHEDLLEQAGTGQEVWLPSAKVQAPKGVFRSHSREKNL